MRPDAFGVPRGVTKVGWHVSRWNTWQLLPHGKFNYLQCCIHKKKKYTDIGKSFTVIPVSGGLWKTLALAGPWQNKDLKYSKPAYSFVTDGRKNKVEYISKTENMNISREQNQRHFAVWTEISNRSEPKQTLRQRNTFFCVVSFQRTF